MEMSNRTSPLPALLPVRGLTVVSIDRLSLSSRRFGSVPSTNTPPTHDVCACCRACCRHYLSRRLFYPVTGYVCEPTPREHWHYCRGRRAHGG